MWNADNQLTVIDECSGYTASTTVTHNDLPSLMVSPDATMAYILRIIGDAMKCSCYMMPSDSVHVHLQHY